MRKYVKNTSLLFGLIYFTLILFIAGFYYYYSSDFSNRMALSYSHKTHDLYENRFNGDLNTDYDAFVAYVNSQPSIGLMNSKKNLVSNSHINYIAFYEINDHGITIGNAFFEFENEIIFERNYKSDVSFFKLSDVLKNNLDETLYGVFFHNGYIGLFDGESYLSDINSADNVIIMRKNGFMLLSKNATNKIILNNYIDDNTTSMFDQYFSLGKSGSLFVSVNNIKQVMVFTPLELTDELYYITFYNLNDIVVHFQSLDLFIIAGLVFIVILYIGTNLLIFYTTAIKFSDVENAKLKLYYNIRLLMKLNSKGKIVYVNHHFKKTFADYRKYKTVDNFTASNPNVQPVIFEEIKKLKDISLIFNRKDKTSIFDFNVVRMGLGYLLIGSSSESTKHSRNYENLALINMVTKLPNQNYLIQYLNNLVTNSKISKNKYVLAGINILDFKGINKLVGEKVANETLVELAKTIENSLKGFNYNLFNSYVDNFVVIFEKPKNIKVIETWAENLINYIEASSSMSGSSLQLDIRVGIYDVNLIMGEEITGKQIYDRMKVALKHANQQDSIKYSIYDVALRDMVLTKARMEESLVNAVENNEFEMHLQPQFNTKTQKIESFEALIRWNNPKYNHVSPSEFIRVAEENNLIVHIGHMVMEETIKIAKRLEKYNIVVGMNISPVQMIQRGFVQQFEVLMEKYKIKPKSIAVEITETFMVSSLQLVSDKLLSLQKLGINIHLDDFGTGYSTLIYLKDLPIDLIKIDKQFIDNITTDKYSKAIVNMIVSLSKSLNVGVIAEGVETDAQAKALSKAGVSVIQGFLISKAVPIDQAIQLLEKYNSKKNEED